jgi:hypothetical protein
MGLFKNAFRVAKVAKAIAPADYDGLAETAKSIMQDSNAANKLQKLAGEKLQDFGAKLKDAAIIKDEEKGK